MMEDYSQLFVDNFNHINVQTDIETLKDHLVTFKNKSNLSILSVNIRSLRANLNLLLAYIAAIDYKYDFIIVTETWLDIHTNIGLEIPGYISENTYRNKHGGGVSIFYLSTYNVSVIPELSLVNECFESLFLKITFSNNIIVCLGAVYRPPSCNLNQFNISFKDLILSKIAFQKIIIAGDFNVDLLNNNLSLSERSFINSFSEFNLDQLIKHPTRVTSNTSSLIDHIWTSLSSIKFTSVTDFQIADHYPVCVLFHLNETFDETKLVTFRTCSNNALQMFKENFTTIYFKYMNCQLTCPHQLMIDFLTEFENLIELIFPFRTIISKPAKLKAPWISKSILQCIRKKHRIYKKYKLGLLPYSSFKCYRNLLNKALKLAKMNYHHDKIYNCYNDTKQLWSVINKLRKPIAKTLRHTLNINDNLIVDNMEIANHFNNYFTALPYKLQEKISYSQNRTIYNIPFNENSFVFFPIFPSEIFSLINNLQDKNFHSCPTPPRLIKLIANPIADILSRLFNHCFQSCTFPDILKIAKILPLPKKGDLTNIVNHRPISILSPFTKLFEKLIFNRLNSFFIQNKLFSDQQFGFIKGRGTQDAIINFLFDVNKAINDKKYTLVTFLDFSKAFDMVSHEILLAKLERYGVRGHVLNFFKSYFNSRKQYVSINGQDSIIKNMKIGVPQGSSLGPLFFLIYSNDITLILENAKPDLYADDTTLYKSGNDIFELQNIMNKELNNILCWSNENKLLLNAEKTKCMLLTTLPHPYFSLTLNNVEIEKVKEYKFLGIWLQDNLKFNKHISELTSTISKSNGMIYSLKHVLPHSTLKILYYSFVFSHLNQNILAWGGAFKTTLKPLNIAHNNVIRNLSTNIEGKRTKELYADQNILTIAEIYQLRLSEFMYLSFSGHRKLNFDFISDVSWHHAYNTRNNDDFRTYFCRLEINKCFFLNHALLIWQNISDDIKKSVSISVFRNKMKCYLLNH